MSSPGIDRPLTRLQDFADWAGHEARVTLAEPVEGRKQLNGILRGTEGEAITVDVRNFHPMTVPFGAVADAKLVMTDALIAATQPLSADGADEIIETQG